MLPNQRMGYLSKSDIEKLLIVCEMFFFAHKWVARPCPRLPFRVGHHVCLGPTGEAFVAFVAQIWPRYSHMKLRKKHSISNRQNDQINRKQKNWPYIYLLYWFFRIYKIFTRNILGIVLWPKVVKQYFHLKSCWIVKN